MRGGRFQQRTDKFNPQEVASIPAFQGDSRDKQTVHEWFKRFELLAQIYQWGPEARLGALLSKLESAALTQYFAHADRLNTYQEVKDLLIERFKPVRTTAVHATLFRRRTQRSDETVGAYYDALCDLYHQAFPTWSANGDEDGEKLKFLGGTAVYNRG